MVEPPAEIDSVTRSMASGKLIIQAGREVCPARRFCGESCQALPPDMSQPDFLM